MRARTCFYWLMMGSYILYFTAALCNYFQEAATLTHPLEIPTKIWICFIILFVIVSLDEHKKR